MKCRQWFNIEMSSLLAGGGDGAGEGPAPGAAERGGQAGGGENPAQNGQQARAAGLSFDKESRLTLVLNPMKQALKC